MNNESIRRSILLLRFCTIEDQAKGRRVRRGHNGRTEFMMFMIVIVLFFLIKLGNLIRHVIYRRKAQSVYYNIASGKICIMHLYPFSRPCLVRAGDTS